MSLDDELADLALGVSAKEDAVRQNDRAFAIGFERLDHVQEKRIVAALRRRHGRDAVLVAPALERILLLCAFHPALDRERRIGESVVECLQVRIVRLVKRIGEGVPVLQLRIVDAVDDHRHLRHADGRKILLLSLDGDLVERTVRLGCRPDEERTRSARHVVDGDHRTLVRRDVHDPRHDAAHFAGGVELPLGLAGLRGEVLHQILVGVADEIVVRRPVVGEVEILVLKDADEVRDGLDKILALAEFLLVGEVRVRDRSRQLFVRLADAGEDHVHALADVRLALERDEIVESAAVGQIDVEIGVAVLGAVADVLDEQDDQHVVLVLARVHAAPQFVARLPELRVELRLLDRHLTILRPY